MKQLRNPKLMISLLLLASLLNACEKRGIENQEGSKTGSSSNNAALSSELHLYQQINLVADVTGYNSEAIDKHLLNAWGLSFSPSGGIWVASNHNGLSTEYDIKGSVLHPRSEERRVGKEC